MSAEKLSPKKAKERMDLAEALMSIALERCHKLGVTVIACPSEVGANKSGGANVHKIILNPGKLTYRHPDAN